MKSRSSKRTLWVTAAVVCVLGIAGAAVAMAAGHPLKKGLKVFVIPKQLGNSYFTTSDSLKSGGALAALKELGATGKETSGNAATAASQIPAIKAAISKGADALVVSATDPKAICPTLKQAIKKGVAVVTYDADAPTCRSLFINQANNKDIGASEVDLLAKEIKSTGKIAIVSAAASAPNQNVWIGFMKTELKKYPNIQLVSTVYGNDDPTVSTQVTQGLLQKYPDLKGIIAPTTVGVLAAAQVVSQQGKSGNVIVTGLGTPLAMKKYVLNGTVPAFELWNPADLGYLAAYASVELASKAITNAPGQTFKAGKLGTFKVGAGHSILLGKPFVFNKANVGKFKF